MKIFPNFDPKKFSFAELTANSDGKTSASGTMGILICTSAAIGFLWGVFTKQSEVVNQAIAYTVFGAGLLGYRKSKENPQNTNTTIVEDPVVKPEDPKKDQSLNS
jgi:hypothetical protein